SLGTGLGRLKGRVFRIGHLGDFNDLMLAGTLSGVEMGLAAAGVPFTRGGITAALQHLERAVSFDPSQERTRRSCLLPSRRRCRLPLPPARSSRRRTRRASRTGTFI